jgi:hypothetical protein
LRGIGQFEDRPKEYARRVRLTQSSETGGCRQEGNTAGSPTRPPGVSSGMLHGTCRNAPNGYSPVEESGSSPTRLVRDGAAPSTAPVRSPENVGGIGAGYTSAYVRSTEITSYQAIIPVFNSRYQGGAKNKLMMGAARSASAASRTREHDSIAVPRRIVPQGRAGQEDPVMWVELRRRSYVRPSERRCQLLGPDY